MMSSHVHLIISAKNPLDITLSDIIRDVKKFTSKQIIQAITNGTESRKEWLLDKFIFPSSKNSRNNTYQFWIQDNHAEELVTENFQFQKLTYIMILIIIGTVKEGWVDLPEHYKYSSAINYCGGKGLVPIEFL